MEFATHYEAAEYIREHLCLPEDFDQWELADMDGWTVAHEAAFVRCLPDNFGQWNLADNSGKTVAQVAAVRKTKPC